MSSHGNYRNNIAFYYTQVIPSLLVSSDEVKLQARSVVFYGAIIVYSSIKETSSYKSLFYNINDCITEPAHNSLGCVTDTKLRCYVKLLLFRPCNLAIALAK